ncbi:MAG: hypothetical protein KDD69_06200 [Bdellovibrionales bacterium]|nr:hypothetical protein [Bdellovibrionales bacterium]
MDWLYLIWLLLPLTFIGLALWAIAKPLFGVQGYESPKSYLGQALYCGFALAIAIGIDQTDFFVSAVESLSMGMLDIAVARWLLYPAVLLVLAYGQKIVRGESSKRTLPTRFIYN